MQVHSLAEGTFCKCMVGWLRDCVCVGGGSLSLERHV